MKLGFNATAPCRIPSSIGSGFMVYLIVCTVMFIVLMFTSIPRMYELFNVEPSGMKPLWTLGELRK